VKEDENNSSINNNNKDNKYEFKKMPSINNYNNIFEKIVNDIFTSNPLYLSFNIKDFSFNLTDNMSHNKNFIDYLKKEAFNKMNIYNEYLKSIKKKSSSTLTESEDESEKYSSSNTELVSSSSSSSTSKNNSITQKSFSKIKTIKSFVPSQTVIKLNNINKKIQIMNKSQTTNLFKSKERNSLLTGKGQNQINKILKNEYIKQNTKTELNNYYKTNLNNIHLYIYDFNRELFIENKEKKISKMEEILKNKINICFGKDNKYPSFSFHKKNNKIKKEDQNPIDKEITNIENKKKSFEEKIKELINKEEDDKSVYRLKIISIISFFVILICGAINLYFNLFYYKSIKLLINLIKQSIIMRYSYITGIYYAREITLLNVNVPRVVGGQYNSFPASNKGAYKSLIAQKLLNLYLDNKEAIKYIVSTTYSLSKNHTEYYSNYSSDFFFRYQSTELSFNASSFSILIQFNNILQNFVYEKEGLSQSHTDIYIYNRNIVFQSAIKELLEIYGLELEEKGIIIKFYYCICLIVYFIIFAVIYFIILISFIYANKKRINYMEIFYGINENILKESLKNTQKLINKLEKIKNNKKK
jgi:hypothetical protein